jgi:hypothetical protein
MKKVVRGKQPEFQPISERQIMMMMTALHLSGWGNYNNIDWDVFMAILNDDIAFWKREGMVK